MKFNKFNIAVAALAALVFAGCQKDDVSRQHYENKLFISASQPTEEMLIRGTVPNYERELTAGIAKPEGHDISLSFAAAPELLDHYRQAFYDQEAVILPEANYQIERPETKIQAGSVKSIPVTIQFVDISSLDKSLRYVLPVTISSVQGIDMLNSARSVYFIFKGAALINVVADLTENRAWPDWKDATPVTDMKTFTLEALICGNAFNKQLSTIMGIEGQFLIRLGDNGVDPNQIQIASANNLTNSDLKLDINRWYHIAVTFDGGQVKVYLDGVQKLEGNVNKSSVNFGVAHSEEDKGKPRCFWIGYSYDKARYLDGMISEVRIWNKVLTAEQINSPEHFYVVEPASDGLVSYWKFDEGVGATVKDHTSFGNDLTIGNEPKWVPVSLPQIGK